MKRRKVVRHSFVWLFVIGALVGFWVENIYCWVKVGEWTSRQGLVLGPFVPIYGVGAVLFAWFLGPWHRKHSMLLFVLSSLLGGCIEFFGSLLGIRLWDFSQQTYHLAGRTSLVFMFFWGVIGTVYLKVIYPILLKDIRRYLVKHSASLRLVMVFFLFNFTLSGLALNRWTERCQGHICDSVLDQKLDQYFHDESLAEIYPALELADRSGEK
ncbi:putative ABC transporter permease [Enterococcus sp. AZ109]|uniref:putative ABC transporter permease n=1 Tax=Enterococcus sp. AZ109 TaxID=2774634 RepID=UPI003F229B12